ncbi:MAG: asparagine synthase-related protein [Candidatus Heimdallarchaeota archaeon]
MTGIVGIDESGKRKEVEAMLDKIEHRGQDGRAILEFDNATFGVVWTNSKENPIADVTEHHAIKDCAGTGRQAIAKVTDDGLSLLRDPLGVAPLYYGRTGNNGEICFASEVKALIEITEDAHEVPPGYHYEKGHLQPYFLFETLNTQPFLRDFPERIAEDLHRRLNSAVSKCLNGEEIIGSWLSGGLDSSIMAALARPKVKKLHTFAIGLPNAPDLEKAHEVADFIQSDHHETIVDLEDLLAVLPEVIYHLESFDAWLVRSSLTNYLVASVASKYVSTVLSGEGADELFAGYAYLKELAPSAIQEELIDITGRLHNTALQRVDRSAAAHGTIAHVPFLDPEVVNYAIRIPPRFKLQDGVEKWILREAMDNKLPQTILDRTKSKFWEGAGIGDLLTQFAEKQISDFEFTRERELPNGWVLNSKEELMYYLIFRGHFGKLENLSWMGRTKGVVPSVY